MVSIRFLLIGLSVSSLEMGAVPPSLRQESAFWVSVVLGLDREIALNLGQESWLSSQTSCL